MVDQSNIGSSRTRPRRGSGTSGSATRSRSTTPGPGTRSSGRWSFRRTRHAAANSELFVNVGPPGTPVAADALAPVRQRQVIPEFLFLVNGQDDNSNGWIDEGCDGVDNN